MKKLFLTLCAISTLAFAGGYTLVNLNRDQGHRAMQAQIDADDIEQAADQRAGELQDKLDEIEAQLEAQNEQQEDTQPQPQTRVQTFADYTNAGKAQELIKSWQIGQTRSVQTCDGQTIGATLQGQVDSYQHLPRRGRPGDAWMIAGTPWIWERPAGTDFATWIDL